MNSLPQKLDLALVTRLRQVVAGEVATEAELRALDDEAGGWLRSTEAQLRAAENRLTGLNADPAASLAEDGPTLMVIIPCRTPLAGRTGPF